jgi:hypothetical protein
LFGHRFDGITDVLRDWPSMYELLPRYRAVWRDGRWLYPHELPPTAVAGLSIPKVREAHARHLALEAAVTEARGKASDHTFRAVRSYMHGADSWGYLDDGRLRICAEVPKGADGYISAPGGDGTVPWFSALPVPYDSADPAAAAAYVVPSTARHRTLMTTSEALAPLAALARGTTVAARGGNGGLDEPALGLDLEDFASVGQIHVKVRPYLPEDGSDVAAITVTCKDPDGCVRKVKAGQRDGAWLASLPTTISGIHDVTVRAALATGHTASLTVKDQVAVVGDEF